VQPSIVIGLVGDEVIVDDMPLRNPEAWGPVIRRLQQNGVERVTISRGVTFEQLESFVHALAGDRGPDPLNVPIGEQQPIRGHAASSLLAPFPTLPHIRLGRVSSERRSQGRQPDMATITRIYRGRRVGRRQHLGQRAHGRRARRHHGPHDDRRARSRSSPSTERRRSRSPRSRTTTTTR
jgi:hypothetical protein